MAAQPPVDAELERRLAAERAFHNEKFGAEQAHSGSDAIYALPFVGYRYLEREIRARADGADVLEYGCGESSYIVRLNRWGGRVTAIDISDEAIEAGKREAAEAGFLDATTFVRMNAESLDFPDNSFDLVVGRAILHHLDLERAYASLARVLRPGGTAIFMEPLGHNPLINLYRRFTPHLRTEDEHPLLMRDLVLARRYFEEVRVQPFTLLAMGALAFAKLPRAFDASLKVLDGVDRALFRALPIAGRWAWSVAMVMERPKG